MSNNIVTPRGFKRIELHNRNGEVKRTVFSPDKATSVDINYFVYRFFKKEVKFPSVKDCIKPHIGNLFFLKMDIKDAFGSIRYKRVKNFVSIVPTTRDLFFHECDSNGLIQGSPASPFIFEKYCNDTIDLELKKFCKKINIKYTRYRDDLIFSSRKCFSKKTRKILRNIIRGSYFSLNEKKDKVVFVGKGKSLEVLGLVIQKNRADISNSFRKKILKEELKRDGGKKLRGLKAHERYVLSINNNEWRLRPCTRFF